MKKNIFKLFLVFLLTFFASACFFSSGGGGPSVRLYGNEILSIGETIIIEAKVEPTEKYEQNVTWSVSDNLVATVDENGHVSGLNEGRVTIFACYEDDNYEIIGRKSVRVVKNKIEYTNESPTTIKLYGEEKVFVSSIVFYRFETFPENASQEVEFESSNESIATINNNGVATFHNVGNVVLKVVSSKNKTISASISIVVSKQTKSSDLEQALIDCIENSKNSVLGVANYVYSGNQLVKESVGSGFVYDCWGYLSNGNKTYNVNDTDIVRYGYRLISNKHVVEGSDAVNVYLHQIDEEIEAFLIAYDSKLDLAVIEFSYEEYIRPLAFYNSKELLSGNIVVAIGNPEGFEFSSSATMGIVSHPLRYLSDDTDGDNISDWDAAYIQHDAAINPGNSGGPLFNLYGQVIGINTLKFAATEIDNMGFSIPSYDISELIPYLEKGIVPTRAKIGITISSVKDLLATPKTSWSYNYIIPNDCRIGLYITVVDLNSPAYNKLFADDILLKFNGLELKNSIDLRAELGKIVVGSDTEIDVVVLRNNKEITVKLIF